MRKFTAALSMLVSVAAAHAGQNAEDDGARRPDFETCSLVWDGVNGQFRYCYYGCPSGAEQVSTVFDDGFSWCEQDKEFWIAPGGPPPDAEAPAD